MIDFGTQLFNGIDGFDCMCPMSCFLMKKCSIVAVSAAGSYLLFMVDQFSALKLHPRTAGGLFLSDKAITEEEKEILKKGISVLELRCDGNGKNAS